MCMRKYSDYKPIIDKMPSSLVERAFCLTRRNYRNEQYLHHKLIEANLKNLLFVVWILECRQKILVFQIKQYKLILWIKQSKQEDIDFSAKLKQIKG
jgi:hypothetical protein